MDIGQAPIGAIVAEGQFFVVDPKQVKNGGMEIVAIGFVFNGSPGPFVAFTVSESGLEARASHPGDESTAVVIAPNAALAERYPPKFPGPNQQGCFQ